MDLYKCVPPMQESVILARAELGKSVFLAPNLWYPLSLYQQNFADAGSGWDDTLFHFLSSTWGNWGGCAIYNISSGINRVFIVHVVRLETIVRLAMSEFTT